MVSCQKNWNTCGVMSKKLEHMWCHVAETGTHVVSCQRNWNTCGVMSQELEHMCHVAEIGTPVVSCQRNWNTCDVMSITATRFSSWDEALNCNRLLQHTMISVLP